MHFVALSYIKLGVGLIRLVRWTIFECFKQQVPVELRKKMDAVSGSVICVTNCKTT